MFLFMLYSGYLSGSIYLNTFFIITQKNVKKLDKPEYYSAIKQVAFEDQEIAINIALIGMDLGFMLSAISGFLIYEFYPDYSWLPLTFC